MKGVVAPPGAAVLEVDTNGTTWCYRHIAGALSLDYRPLAGNFTWHTTSFHVDEDALMNRCAPVVQLQVLCARPHFGTVAVCAACLAR